MRRLPSPLFRYLSPPRAIDMTFYCRFEFHGFCFIFAAEPYLLRSPILRHYFFLRTFALRFLIHLRRPRRAAAARHILFSLRR